MMETQQRDPLAGVQEAVLQAAIAPEIDIPVLVPPHMKSGVGTGKQAVSPLNGVPTPPGRPLGVKNRLTNLRDAVLEAFDRVGGADYLVRLAEGTQSDRAAFTGLMAKILPSQIQAQVEGGIKLELSWLGQRQIGTTAAQIEQRTTQVLDIERDADGKYRILDQRQDAAGGQAAAAPAEPDAISGPTSDQEG